MFRGQEEIILIALLACAPLVDAARALECPPPQPLAKLGVLQRSSVPI